MTDLSKFVQEHVALFNMGVRTGDFGPMLAGLLVTFDQEPPAAAPADPPG